MAAPKNPNMAAAHAAKAAGDRQRKIQRARVMLIEAGEPVLTRTDVIEMFEQPVYRKEGVSSAWLIGYFKLNQ